MKVFLTGGTGFVGQEVQRQLLQKGHQVRLLCHSQKQTAENPDVEIIQGDTTLAESLQAALQGCDVVINLVGIIREFPGRNITFERLHTETTRNLLHAAKVQGVSRFLQMSANGTRSDAITGYHKTKWAAEQLVRESGLDWTIFRPSLIFGKDDMFVNMLAGLIRKLPVVPVMGDGKYRLQPVAVTDVAAGFVNALDTPETSGKTYHCGGPEAYSYNQILDLIGATLGKKSVCKIHQPLLLMKPVVSVMQSLPQFPMTSDQLQMLLEENICDPAEWQKDLQLELTDFKEGISQYLT
ncbi:NADH dehydrogenase [Malonomonas rubra DSM 5091]|uniref:NADH dehydrogenase n=1 Tax=Malonomonas rubra DSM 5091 TaxID=1122189 RepID=A0A1M6JWZ7_MALRU|nr:complex I NDUFA9 subunit family protein [Malonomonas rubra]SHJ51214.1 NADH dehydrogenase [Malonomonas rubra DSM 5091]